VLLVSKKDPSNKVTNYTYDSNGNLTKAVYDPTGANQTTTYKYDTTNRLIEVDKPNGSIVTFTYDADGNRISKTVNGTTVNDVYAQGRLDHQADSAGNILATFTYDTSGEPTSVVVGAPTTGTRYYYVYNAHGDVVALVDSSGAVQASYSYDAFGNLTSSSETLANGWSNPYRFDGAELVRYDPETNLYWMSVRAYDPTLGRFISHDPLGRLAAKAMDFHPYVYAGNNPLTKTDPSGMLVAPIGGGGGNRALRSRFFIFNKLSSTPATMGRLAPSFIRPSSLPLPLFCRIGSFLERCHHLRPRLQHDLPKRHRLRFQQGCQEDEPPALQATEATGMSLGRRGLADPRHLGCLRSLALCLAPDTHGPGHGCRHRQPEPLDSAGLLHFAVMPAPASAFHILEARLHPGSQAIPGNIGPLHWQIGNHRP
jgi:RHS repeat-associated protein